MSAIASTSIRSPLQATRVSAEDSFTVMLLTDAYGPAGA